MRNLIATMLFLLPISVYGAAVVLLDSTGAFIGIYLGANRIVTQQGYEVGIDRGTGEVFNPGAPGFVWYASDDCTGQGFYNVGSKGFGGIVIIFPGGTALYYSPLDSEVTRSFAYQSELGSGGCLFAPGQGNVVPVFLNDPAVTGIISRIYSTPLIVEVREECVFRDGFECPVAVVKTLLHDK